MTLTEIAEKLHARKNSDGSWVVESPEHRKDEPSHDIEETDKSDTPSSSIVTAYDYTDLNGNLLFQVVELEHDEFKERRPHPSKPGTWIWNTKGIPGVFYRHTEVARALEHGESIFIASCEKNADALSQLGVTATCVSGGGWQWTDEHTASLTDADVVVVAGWSNTGIAHADLTGSMLYGKVKSVKIIELPGRNDDSVEDASSWVEAGGTLEELSELVEQAPLCETPSACSELPTVPLPGGEQTIGRAASQLAELLGKTGKHYVRGGVAVRLDKDNEGAVCLKPLSNSALASEFEVVASLQKMEKDGPAPTVCSEQTAKTIATSTVFQNTMPPIKVVSPCPVLTAVDRTLITVEGYHRPSGILALKGEVKEVPLVEAVTVLKESVMDFRFASEADRSRAFAAIVTPGMVFGGLLPGRSPIDLGEADNSQTGKGYRNKLTATIYGQSVKAVTQKKGGVGSMEESFNTALLRAAGFISFDNMRGKIDSPALESFMTEESYFARTPYREPADIDPRRTVIMMTSNKADMTEDLANRCSCVRILHQPDGYAFRQYPEGDLLDHVRANRGLYLGAVFAVIKAWHAAGKPRTNETRHDFRPWAQTLDWIVQNIFQVAPLMEGHRETQNRMTNSALNWLREVAIAVVRHKKDSQWLRTSEIVDILTDTEIELPGLPENGGPNDKDTRTAVLPVMGHKLKQCFTSGNKLVMDGIVIERRKTYDGLQRKEVWSYAFAPAPIGNGSSGAHQAQNGCA